MRCLRYLPLPLSLISLLLPTLAAAEPWVEDKVFFTESAKLGSSMVDAADLDGDGWIDLVFADGSGYDKGDMLAALPQQAFKNLGGTGTMDISADIFAGANSFNGRAVKIRDIDRDGDNDIMLGCTWQKQSQLLLNTGGVLNNVTPTNLPQYDASIGDLELGDVDGDGDLDMVLADWGPDAPVGDPVSTEGGITQLWLQDGEPASFSAPGTGTFMDYTLDNMPLDKVRWSWDLEFVDIDNDWDLDVVVSCFACSKQSVLLFANDGAGVFSNVTADNVTQGLGAFDVEAIDINGDAFLDLVTLRDGTGGRNRVLLNDTNGAFKDNTDLIWPKLENPASFDHMQAFLDYNSDGKPDIVVGAFNPGKVYPDRLMENQGNNTFKQNTFAFNAATPATYALVLARFYGVSADSVGLYLLPFAAGNLLGPLLLGGLFDSVGRRTMITATYAISGLLLILTGWLFAQGALTATTQTALWSAVFFVASAAASSAYLTVSELFPVELRGMAIALFYAVGTAAGGLLAPGLFSALIQSGSRNQVFAGYILGGMLMLGAAGVAFALGLSVERQSLEHIAGFD